MKLYQVSYFSETVGDAHDFIMKLTDHLNGWADDGWTLAHVNEHRVEGRGRRAEHVMYWEKDFDD